ncbi:hypothetical protein L2E82_20538 [Cichorium intybus]|uniref:Uncharacterized protein n=1 Tax=Cichorium intybus TaxID=13427 RepID=A0ACB9DTM2_CICIN|nr:hypothetical protein L2E82_20538 [Cichorium intybus]
MDVKLLGHELETDLTSVLIIGHVPKLIVIDHVLKMPLLMTQQAIEVTMETGKKVAIWVNPFMLSSWKSTYPNHWWCTFPFGKDNMLIDWPQGRASLSCPSEMASVKSKNSNVKMVGTIVKKRNRDTGYWG